jgi:hypothetical protein
VKKITAHGLATRKHKAEKPRYSALGVLDEALGVLAMTAHTSPHLNTDRDVRLQRKAIVERVRRMLVAERKRNG